MGKRAFTFLNILAVLVAISSPVYAGTVLITEQEASLPPERVAVGQRGITRGPRVELIQPSEKMHSPVHFQIRFRSFGGAAVDLETLHIVYLKTPEIDITPRVKPFTQPGGIDVPDAEIPAGEHFLRVEVSDSEGRTRDSVFSLKISP